jgi:uncharacterized protein DUF302
MRAVPRRSTALLTQESRKVNTMNEPTTSGTPPSVEGIESRPSPFAVEAMQEAHVLIFGNPKGGTPLMIASPLLALDLPLKVLVWQSADGQVWVNTNSVSYLSERYALPHELVGPLAVVDAVMEQALTP